MNVSVATVSVIFLLLSSVISCTLIYFASKEHHESSLNDSLQFFKINNDIEFLELRVAMLEEKIKEMERDAAKKPAKKTAKARGVKEDAEKKENN